MKLLEGKRAVVTGSTKGIGRGIAIELARHGAAVVVNHRPAAEQESAAKEARETLDRIREVGCPQAILCEADVTTEEGVRRLGDAAVEALGGVDMWVNNVGIHVVTPALGQSLAEWERLFRINTGSAFLGCRTAAEIMKARAGGTIINIASKMGLVAAAENACYCSAKAAVVMMTKSFAAEWASFGIRVNCIAPGVTLTDPTYAVVAGRPALEAALHYRTPLGRFAEPAEIGKVAVFLASDLASFVTGAIIACDGGWTAHGDFAGIPAQKVEEWAREFPRLSRPQR